jgi:hypothetical protein
MIKKVKRKVNVIEKTPVTMPTTEASNLNSTPLVIVTPAAKGDSKKITEGWVIQYGAFKSREGIKLPKLSIDNFNGNQPALYLAQKLQNNKKLYYLISDTFSSKSAAQATLINNNGWVVPLKTFSNVTKFQP